ncbi:32752_t:CDS:2, partial [Gigaspora margarita]
MNKISQKDIDNIWVSIESEILYAAKHNIPFKKVSNSTKKALSTNRKTKSSLQKDTISISKICQELKKLARENKDQKAISALSNLDETASIEEWAQDIKNWLYIFNKKWALALEKEKMKESK